MGAPELLLAAGFALAAWLLIRGPRPERRGWRRVREPWMSGWWRLLIAGALVVLVLSYVDDIDLSVESVPSTTVPASPAVTP